MHRTGGRSSSVGLLRAAFALDLADFFGFFFFFFFGASPLISPVPSTSQPAGLNPSEVADEGVRISEALRVRSSKSVVFGDPSSDGDDSWDGEFIGTRVKEFRFLKTLEADIEEQ